MTTQEFARTWRECVEASRTIKPLNHAKAYSAYRLEEQNGAVWRHGVDANGWQDHYAIAYDGSQWRMRKPSQYYSVTIGKLMMVCVTPSEVLALIQIHADALAEGRVDDAAEVVLQMIEVENA